MNSNQRVEHNTYSTTWGSIKSEKAEIARMVTADMKIVIKQTKAVIESDDTILPDGDITIYLFPGKVKSGVIRNIVKESEAEAKKIFEGFVIALGKDIQAMKQALPRVKAPVQAVPKPPVATTYSYKPTSTW